MIDHPYLQDPENARAFQQLTAVPTGTVRKWGQLLGWKPGRMQRFLKSVVKYELAEVESCKQHSTFRPLRGVADCSDSSATLRYTPKLSTASSLTTQASLRRRARRTTEPQPGAELLIDAMNKSMRRYDSYRPVKSENDGSHRAARRWLVDEGIPLEEAITLLYRAAEAWDIDRAPGHDYPESIAYFSKVVLVKWHWIKKNREQLGLFPKMEMHVERIPEYVPDPAGAATPEGISKGREEFLRAADSPHKPNRL